MAFTRGLIEALEASGVARADLLRGSSLSDAQLASSERNQPLIQLDQLVERALDLTGDPALGLHWWQRATFGAFGAVAHALTVVQHFRSGVDLMARYWPLFSSLPLFYVYDEPELCRISMVRHSPSLRAHRAYMESVAFSLRRLLRQHAGIAGVPRLIAFDYPAPDHVEVYEQVLGCPLRFNAPATEVVVDREHALQPQPNYVADLEARLTEYADGLLAQHGFDGLSARVLNLLRASPDNHRLTMDEIASQLGTSGRTLRRRLQSEGTPFPALVQRVQREQAEAMLLDPTRSVKQVAHALGFADASAFHRAVRRWTGKSPAALRPSSSAPPPPKASR
ncbi:MAG: AraC family transcriptional regulator ligand-binding domain-containing protein [Myxococcales bacterium]